MIAAMATDGTPGTATIVRLLGQRQLDVRSLVAGDARRDAPIAWIASSDLDDPTPFLSPGHVLLTTGRQLLEREGSADTYVDALVRGGILGLGFATGLHAPEVPSALVDACAAAALPLFEVPLATPFLAIIHWCADLQRDRERWATSAQRAVAAAALAPTGHRAVVRRLATELGAGVALLDSAGRERATSRTAVPPAALAAARETLRSARRTTSTDVTAEGSVTVATLGSGDRSLGCVCIWTRDPLDTAAQSVATVAAAWLEFSLVSAVDATRRLNELEGALAALALEGQADAVGALLLKTGRRLPSEPIVVASAETALARYAMEDALRDTAGDVLWTADGERLLFVVSLAERERLDAFLTRLDATAGVSQPSSWRHAPVAASEAAAALQRAKRTGAATATFERALDGLLGMLDDRDARDAARAQLSPIAAEADGAERLALVRTWFEQDCSWDATARIVGMHRHSVRSRIRAIAEQLQLDADAFADRATLWALLRAADVPRWQRP
ncbi:purine catabolism regulator [Agrococcus jenensis]|uniref:Purine catabolism regulator n=2 Tax=Agrococcus jenensis TaxID=46353 RepID=A0A3N2AR33_9MICO|nr:purine catabolism regulator [Agrococcus jenensis]